MAMLTMASLLVGVARHQPEDLDGLGLADAMAARHRLHVILGVPVRVIDDHGVRRHLVTVRVGVRVRAGVSVSVRVSVRLVLVLGSGSGSELGLGLGLGRGHQVDAHAARARREEEDECG